MSVTTADMRQIASDLGKVGTGTLGSLLQRNGIPGIIEGLRMVDPSKRFAGTALTAKVLYGPPGTYTQDDFALASFVDQTQPGDVLVIDADGGRAAVMGGIAALAAQMRGAVGIVADGALRDVDEMFERSMPAYTRHVTLPSGVGMLKYEATNVDVTICGIKVAPGDILVGDCGGLVVIPKDKAVGIHDLAMKAMARDEAGVAALKAGKSFTEVIEIIRSTNFSKLA